MEEQEQRRIETFEKIQAAESVQEGVHILRDNYSIEHASYHLAQTVAGSVNIDAPYVKTTYPAEWVGHYVMKGYVNVDPVIKEGVKRLLPFDWSELEPDESAIGLFTDFQTFGLDPNGYSIPIIDKVSRRALLSLNGGKDGEDWSSIVEQYREDWSELGYVLHKKAISELFGESDPTPALAPRELEVLHWTALGKDHKDIGVIIGISENTIRSYSRSARYKLDCSSLSQAVAKAIQMRLINPK
ncbi:MULTISPECIES: helix-turn-helix transcriptional regulator [unclassified Lentilitoribacter]|jgi:DNA-binding CsgD family transcriptional regulator|uniref:helix-turn-helix transcriptional regulator n=1 Tax=unclassified Lentilitoribacter TaxID=2647570 RepID=UPI0013A6DDF7|nr:LuxR family transcriptional regulator [Lentilitoribacter sp. Alg239-R112]